MHNNKGLYMEILNKILELHNLSGQSDIFFITSIGSKDKNLLNNWKKGITKSYMKYLPQIAEHFNVSVDIILGNDSLKTEKVVLDSDIKFALFGTDDIDDEVLDEVRRYAQFVKDREKQNGNKNGV